VYGGARFGAEGTAEVMLVHIRPTDSKVDSELRFTGYTASSALVDPSKLAGCAEASKLVAELTSAPTDPPDEPRKLKMKVVVEALAKCYGQEAVVGQSC
jgi:hypothetical protein